MNPQMITAQRQQLSADQFSGWQEYVLVDQTSGESFMQLSWIEQRSVGRHGPQGYGPTTTASGTDKSMGITTGSG
jgi:hypothetical protein